MACYTPHFWWNVSTRVMGNGPYRHTWVNRTVAAYFAGSVHRANRDQIAQYTLIRYELYVQYTLARTCGVLGLTSG